MAAALRSHLQYLKRAALLTACQAPRPLLPLAVVKVLNDSGIRYVLGGLYGLVGWLKEPRATRGVVVYVPARRLKAAVRSLTTSFPNLAPTDMSSGVALRDAKNVDAAVTVLKPEGQPFARLFHHARAVSSGRRGYRVPSLEMSVMMKFAGLPSATRATAESYMDAHDFILMVKQNPDLDETKLAALGDAMYPSGGKDVLELVRRVRAGEKLQL